MQPKILVAYDFSETAESILPWIADLHRTCGGAIRLLHVVPLVPRAVSASGEMKFPKPVEDIAQLEADLKQVAHRAIPDAEAEVMLFPDVAEGILHRAQTWHADFIAMGVYGRGAVRRFVLGSVADVVVRSASCPVLTMRNPTT